MNEQSHHHRLTRTRSDRYIGGVAAGIARHIKVDPGFVRAAFVASLLFGGVGLVVYAVLLALVPVEGDPAEPLPPIEPKRRNWMIVLAVAVGIFSLTGNFSTWIFGFWPGTLFGILLWIAAGTVLAWLLSSTDLGTSGGPVSAGPPSASGERPRSSPADVATYAESPTQLSTELMETAETAGAPHVRQPGKAAGKDENRRPGRSGPAIVGRIMVWVAIGLAALTLFCVLFLFAAGVTVIFGGIPMALLAIILGAGIVFAGLRGQPQLSLWLLTAAVAVTLPMAVVSLADLRVTGSYGDISETPLTTTDLPAEGYRMAAGNMTIDLRKLNFEPGRSIRLPVSGGIGLTSIIVPDRVCVASRVSGSAGLIDIRGRQLSGIDITRRFSPPQGPAPRLKLNAEFKLGMFQVVDSTTWRHRGSSVSRQGDDSRPGEWIPADRAGARNRSDQACRPGIRPHRPSHRKGTLN